MSIHQFRRLGFREGTGERYYGRQLSRILEMRPTGRKENPGLRENLPRVEVGQGRRRLIALLRAAAERGWACVATWVRSNTMELAFALGGAVVASLLVRLIADYGERIEAAVWGVR